MGPGDCAPRRRRARAKTGARARRMARRVRERCLRPASYVAQASTVKSANRRAAISLAPNATTHRRVLQASRCRRHAEAEARRGLSYSNAAGLSAAASLGRSVACVRWPVTGKMRGWGVGRGCDVEAAGCDGWEVGRVADIVGGVGVAERYWLSVITAAHDATPLAAVTALHRVAGPILKTIVWPPRPLPLRLRVSRAENSVSPGSFRRLRL